jgi:hypothetical protein
MMKTTTRPSDGNSSELFFAQAMYEHGVKDLSTAPMRIPT